MKCPIRLELIKPISTFPSTFAPVTTGRVSGVVKPTQRVHKGYIARTFKAAEKRILGLTQVIAILWTLVAIPISVLIQASIMLGKWLAKASRRLISLFLALISMLKKTVNQKPSTGRPNSKRISTWDRLFAYGALIILSAGFIRLDVMPYLAGRMVVVFLAIGLIVKNFKV